MPPHCGKECDGCGNKITALIAAQRAVSNVPTIDETEPATLVAADCKARDG